VEGVEPYKSIECMKKEGAYSGKPGNLWELVNSGKFRENWGHHGVSPTAVLLGDPACPLWEPSPSHPIVLV